MKRPIGYYVHHHGEGHLKRALAIAASNPARFTLLGTGLAGRTGRFATIELPDDRLADGRTFDGEDGERHRPQALHYTPLNHDGVRSRMTTIARWIADTRPGLIVSDVSVEIAMLARLCATPVACIRLSGQRDDVPHLEAFRSASVLIAPFAEPLDDPKTSDWIKQKTFYGPGLVSRRPAARPQAGTVLVVYGRGGATITASDIIAAARHTQHRQWRVIGLAHDSINLPTNLVFAGWTDDPDTEIARAEIVIGGAGDGLVGAVLAARRPFVCIPEPRPFDEQRQKASALDRAGAAVTVEKWPHIAQLNEILDAACAIDPARQAMLDDPDGVMRLSRRLIEVADR